MIKSQQFLLYCMVVRTGYQPQNISDSDFRIQNFSHSYKISKYRSKVITLHRENKGCPRKCSLTNQQGRPRSFELTDLNRYIIEGVHNVEVNKTLQVCYQTRFSINDLLLSSYGWNSHHQSRGSRTAALFPIITVNVNYQKVQVLLKTVADCWGTDNIFHIQPALFRPFEQLPAFICYIETAVFEQVFWWYWKCINFTNIVILIKCINLIKIM